MAPKLLPQAKVNPSKLLGSSKVSASIKKISAKSLESGGINISKFELGVIKKQVVKIKDLINSNYLLKKAEENRKRKVAEQKEFSEREKKLEEKSKDGEDKKVKLPSVPRLSFLDRIKNFLFNVLLGYAVVRLLPHVPKLVGLFNFAGKTLDFLTDLGVGFVDTLGTFIQKGYEAYDFTKKALKSFGGDNALKLFDAFNGAVGKVIEASVIAALAFGELGGGDSGGPGPGGGRRGFDNAGRRTSVDAQRRFAERYGRKEFIKRFGEENLKNLPKSMQRGALQKGARSAFVGVLGKGGAKSVLKVVRPFLKRLPIPVIGALIDFGLSVALGESPGRAAFKAIGAGLAGVIGTAIGSIPPLIPFGGPLIGGILGGWAGDALGSALYDMFFGGKGKSGGKVSGYAGGGTVTRAGKTYTGPAKRTVKKAKRIVAVEPTKIDAGSSVGGEEKITKMFPETNKSDTMNPLGYVENFYDKTSKVPFFGPLFSIATKSLLGDKPSRADYKNAGTALNSWMNSTFSTEVMRGGMFAGGGEVNSEMFMNGDDLSNIIAKSIEESVSSKMDDAIKDLMKQLMLKQPIEGPDKSDPTLETPDDIPTDGTGGQWGPLLDLIAGKESGGNYEAMYPSTTLKGATKMTIAEVARRATGAVGKYQQLPQYLVGRAKAAGLNPDKDLYSPENQEKIIINVNIKGRGGQRWLDGKISDEQFMQGLSQEFASLPNANGVFYYQGQRSSMTPAKVKAALAQVKKGGYKVDLAGGTFTGGGTGSGYGSGGVKIAGDLGDYLKANKGKIGVTGEIHQHPRHPGQKRRSYFSYHNQNRALDIGGWGPAHPSSGGRDEQAPVIRALLAWNKKNGYKPVEIIHGSPAFKGLGKYESAPNALHSNHVHVAYSKGGLVDGVTYAMLGERGREFIIDADSTAAIENTFPGFLDALNRANYDGAIQVLRNYAEYEFGTVQEVIVEQPEPEIVYVPMVTKGFGQSSSVGGSYDSDYDFAYQMG